MNPHKPPATIQHKPAQPGHFRIIGGYWRSRKLPFPAVDGLRPTPDRVRETLFNWLAPYIHGKHCLDLYCGSGALGLEALSRGAASCVFVDASSPALAAIRQHLQLLQGNGAALLGQLPTALNMLEHAVDVVFLDPPYALESHADCLNALIAQQKLADGAWIYCENASDKPLPALQDCELHRHKTTGSVRYALFHYLPASTKPANSLS